MPTSAYIVTFAAILCPALLYFRLAVRERKNLASLRDFFPLTRHLESGVYARSTLSAGVSLATVVLALVNLAPILGIGLLVTIGSYAGGFFLLYLAAPAILRRNPQNKTIQAFLGDEYGSPAVKFIALLFTFVGTLSIFAMELIVGVTVLSPFLGEWVLGFAVIYLGFLVGYSIIAGFRAVVATEQWQIGFIAAAIAILPIFLILLIARAPGEVPVAKLFGGILTSWKTPWSFVIGIVAMNLPAAISDSGSWQRLCAIRSERDARRGLLMAIPGFILLWGSLIVFGCFIAVTAMNAHAFNPAKETLMTFIISSLGNGGVLGTLLLGVLILGLFSALITTADSLLLVAAQMLAIDVMKLQERQLPAERAIKLSRLTLAGIALLSFLVFTGMHLLRFDVVQLVFSIYGASLAVFPSVAAALFLHKRLNLRRAAPAAVISVGAGFSGAWGSAIYGKLTLNLDWLYNAPAVGFIISTVTFLLFSITAWKRESAGNARVEPEEMVESVVE